MDPHESRIDRCLRAGEFYRRRGWNPLPSRADAKRPPFGYGPMRDLGLPAAEFERLVREHNSPNIQLATGSPWGLAVADLDGEGPILLWDSWVASWGLPEAPWIVRGYNADGTVRGQHVWFSIPPECTHVRTGILHGEISPDGKSWVKRTQIERKGDRSLIIAPPSWHVETGQPYRFLEGFGPRDGPLRPGMAPEWFLDMPTVALPRMAPEHPQRKPKRPPGDPLTNTTFSTKMVIEAIPEGEMLSLAREFGLRLASDTPNASGWVSCHSLSRDDRSPSASFNPTSGCFLDFADPGMKPLTIFDIGAEIGGYPTWYECRNQMAQRFIGGPK
jgi:hypothetical protein